MQTNNGASSEERLIGVALGQGLGALRGLRGEGDEQDRFTFEGIDLRRVEAQLESLEKGPLLRLKAMPLTPENASWRPLVKLAYELVRAARKVIDRAKTQGAVEANRSGG